MAQRGFAGVLLGDQTQEGGGLRRESAVDWAEAMKSVLLVIGEMFGGRTQCVALPSAVVNA